MRHRIRAPRHAAPENTKLSYLLRRSPRFLIAGAAIVSLGTAGITTAAFADFGQLDTTFSSDFQVALVNADGEVQLLPDNTLNATANSSAQFVPGDTATIELDVANLSPTFSAGVVVVPSASGALSADIRYSATFTSANTTTTLFGSPSTPANGLEASDPAIVNAQATLVERGATEPALNTGDTWSGPSDTRGVLKVYAHLPGTSGAGLNSNTTNLVVSLQAASQ